MRICLELGQDSSKVTMFGSFAPDAVRAYISLERYPYIQATVPLCASQTLFTALLSSESRMSSFVKIKTNYLRDLVANAVAELDAAAQLNFYTQTSRHPWFRSSSGYILEKFVCTWLFSNPTSEGLLYTPADTTKAETFILHPVGSESVLVFKRCEALPRAQDHTTSGWLPAAQNFPSIDAIIFTDGLIVTIQSVITPTHDPEASN
jgi:hypothetical protein